MSSENCEGGIVPSFSQPQMPRTLTYASCLQLAAGRISWRVDYSSITWYACQIHSDFVLAYMRHPFLYVIVVRIGNVSSVLKFISEKWIGIDNTK